MRIHVGAVGRLKAGPERELAQHYCSRAAGLGRTSGITAVKVVDVAESRAATAELRRAEEAERLTGRLPEQGLRVALDARGRDLSSEEFAAAVGGWRDSGTSDLVFLIGGPDGLAEKVTARAAMAVAFGRMTWPHRLVRIMLLEQIYRAVTILVNHPYHRM